MQRRNTATRTAVLELFRASSAALSHEMVEGMLDRRPNRATIYRILNRLVEDGIAHRIVAEDGRQYFALCRNCEGNDHRHDHLHFRCLGCERVECLPQRQPVELPPGYQRKGINGTVSGYCPACQE